ncbi:DUF2070 family protein [Candidatus Marsarchaeota archaeon]|nr:DUF2070 family protein [Candidatus Marsarchaeota archaeon]MCL5404362.1 DUF2070 family protein [Candidatus Marsarchaeota archaeon]
MENKSYKGALKHVSLFSKNLPNALRLFAILVVVGLVVGVLSAYIVHHSDALYTIPYILINGLVGGLIAIIIPTTITIFIYKGMRTYIRSKYIVFVSLLAETTYAIFMVLSVAVYLISGSYALSIVTIIVGDASIFAWWLFVNKLMMNRYKNASLFSLIQPTLNLIFFLPASGIIFNRTIPLGLLLIKLYAGIFIFLVISYIIIYLIDSPIKRSLGFSGVDIFAQMLQNWLFSINIALPDRKSKNSFGVRTDITVKAITIRSGGKLDSVFFVPQIHFGPVGTLGSSNFPYLVEKYGNSKYKASVFVLHAAVNEDYNAVSSDQFMQVKRAFEAVIDQQETHAENSEFGYYYGESNGAMVKILKFGKCGLITLTRAPKVTEDITPEAAAVIEKALEKIVEAPILVDAHNSRFESAPAEELESVKFNSKILNDYLAAIDSIKAPLASSKELLFGSKSLNAYVALGEPADVAPGNINASVFGIGGKKFGIIAFNANNMKPAFREAIISHVRDKFGIEAEVYTTDTHYINSMRETASNVLGRHTKYRSLEKLVDEAVNGALKQLKHADVAYKSTVIKNFYIWGINQREKMMTSLDSMISLAKVLVPTIIAAGFLVAAWIINLI